jgi:hypothetical protein
VVLGLSPGGGRDISRRPDRHQSPLSLLYDGYRWNVVLTTQQLPVPGGEGFGTIRVLPPPQCAWIGLPWGDLYLITLKANSHMPCRAPAVPLPCHAAPLPFSDSAVSFVKVRVVAGNIRTASPTVERIGMLLITDFVELRLVAGRSRTRAGHLHAVSGRPMLIHIRHAHAALYRGLEKSISEWHVRGMARARHGMCESNTAVLCKSDWKDTI